jgi:hypothetical protein
LWGPLGLTSVPGLGDAYGPHRAVASHPFYLRMEMVSVSETCFFLTLGSGHILFSNPGFVHHHQDLSELVIFVFCLFEFYRIKKKYIIFYSVIGKLT